MNHIRLSILSFLLTGMCFHAFGQVNPSVTIKGLFPDASGKEIRLMQLSDMLTNTEKEIAAAVIDSEGQFFFEYRAFEPQYVFLKIEHGKAGLYIEPGNGYQLVFDAFDFSAIDEKKNPFFDPLFFAFKISGEDSNGLNTLLGLFEPAYQAFVTDHFQLMWRGRQKRYAEDFAKEVDSVFSYSQLPFFKDFVRYKFAGLYFGTKTKTRAEMAVEYLMNQPVLYHNPAYMAFFNAYFEKYLLGVSRFVKPSDVHVCVNVLGSFPALMDTLGKDSVLRNEVLREMVVLKSMGEIYGHQEFRKDRVLSVLKQLQDRTRVELHREIAASYLRLLTELETGMPAPGISLNKDAQNILETHKGKYIYLSFVSSWCTSCELEYELLRTIYARHEKDLAVIGISVDRDIHVFERYLRRTSFPWTMKHFNQNYRLLEKYRITTFPTYVLIDREGKIIQYAAPKPSDNLDGLIRQLIERERRVRP